METIHLISVREASSKDLHACGAKLAVRVAGQSFFTGDQAFTKAAEVAQLVTALKGVGLAEEQVHLRNVSLQVDSGLLTKSSSAAYDLLIDCPNSGSLGPIMAAISSQKNAKLYSIAWKYENLDQAKHEVMQAAIETAKRAAQLVAESLGVALLGVHKLTYEVSGLDDMLRLRSESRDEYRKARACASSLTEFGLSHTTQLVVSVSADFMVERFAASAA
ncbi:SIMPL domain-containing protein [Blastopirellula sp. JC732]|uniref:SIMPL domain-containing protein n=1 Tax=Blastopirellula sediminis TaxID=2894196 RepID=A0A9X1MRT0_9BACT|nr:SIMPL domain-containing protein [Blastopirellula sediminis]MCC9604503.1 SIMPL domain-containing protein [Blastopirellula sediminis]MCC9632198.1 SIMPL domain-containing protein [Blastopirellula sediminis]